MLDVLSTRVVLFRGLVQSPNGKINVIMTYYNYNPLRPPLNVTAFRAGCLY